MTLTKRRPPPYTLPVISMPGAGIASNWTASELLRRCIELLCDINAATVLQAAATARKSLDEPATVQRRAANIITFPLTM